MVAHRSPKPPVRVRVLLPLPIKGTIIFVLFLFSKKNVKIINDDDPKSNTTDTKPENTNTNENTQDNNGEAQNPQENDSQENNFTTDDKSRLEKINSILNDAKNKNMNGVCTLTSKKKKPFLSEKNFFEHFGFKVVDSIGDYELLALKFNDKETPKFSDTARKMKIDDKNFTIYYSPECPYVSYEVKELSEYASKNNININFIKIDSLEKAKNAPCIFNNWANFYKGEFISNTILNANSLEKLIK